MPLLGEIKKANEIERKGTEKYIWQACDSCGKKRWVKFAKGKPINVKCHKCSMFSKERSLKLSQAGKTQTGDKRYNWKGGHRRSGGYILVMLQPDDFFYPMARKDGLILEHRLVIAQRLNRCLLKSEHVHHKDGIKDHNEDSNLKLISPANHTLYKTMCVDCELRKEVRLLRWQIKELTSALQEKLRI